MNRETDTLFLQTVGKFIVAQIQLAVAPLIERIKEQEETIEGLRTQRIEDNNLIFDRLLNAETNLNVINTLSRPEVNVELMRSLVKEEIKGIADLRGPIGPIGPIGPAGEIGPMGKSVEGPPGPPGKDGENGRDGADCDMEAIMARVDKYIENVRPENGQDGKEGPQGPPGKDGADVVAAFRDSDNHLILTLSNGATKDIGLIHGADGKDGASGKDGRDGAAYDQIKFVQDPDDPRQVNVIHAGANGEHVGSFRVPGFIDKGVWRQGNYKTGDSVSIGGSMFLAQVDTDAKPETNKDWRLSVKHGRDGKQGDRGNPGDAGKAGRDGRDLTQMGFDGKKW